MSDLGHGQAPAGGRAILIHRNQKINVHVRDNVALNIGGSEAEGFTFDVREVVGLADGQRLGVSSAQQVVGEELHF